jgi:hypothetical protein
MSFTKARERPRAPAARVSTVAPTRAAKADRYMVADEPAAAADPDGCRLVKHARYYWLLLAEGHLTRSLFGAILWRLTALSVPAG